MPGGTECFWPPVLVGGQYTSLRRSYSICNRLSFCHHDCINTCYQLSASLCHHCHQLSFLIATFHKNCHFGGNLVGVFRFSIFSMVSLHIMILSPVSFHKYIIKLLLVLVVSDIHDAIDNNVIYPWSSLVSWICCSGYAELALLSSAKKRIISIKFKVWVISTFSGGHIWPHRINAET